MNARRVLLAAVLAPLAMLALLPLMRARASDHLDGPGVTADPQCDITDVFTFTSPADPTRVVLAMAVTPYATDASTFSPLVDYAFRVQRVQAVSPLTLDGIAHDVVCEFSSGAPQKVTCTAPGDLAATAVVGDISGGSSNRGSSTIRVFAGMRSDPAFFDRQGALQTLATGQASFTGQNAFAGANVLAIVVEVTSAQLTLDLDGGPTVVIPDGGDAAAASTPILAVAAETYRRGM
jgi:hypothetical protein